MSASEESAHQIIDSLPKRFYLDTKKLDAAEAAYQRAIKLYRSNDTYNRSICLMQIGIVCHSRFKRALQCKESGEVIGKHAEAAEFYYVEGLCLCPVDSVVDLATMHHQLGCLHGDVGRFDRAYGELEIAIQLCEQTGNQLNAGRARSSMGVTYIAAAEKDSDTAHRKAMLLRARAYAESALRDFQRYAGRAVDDETKCKGILEHVDRLLHNLPS